MCTNKCFLQYFIGQCQNGEHGRKDIRLDLILVMARDLRFADNILIFARSTHEIMTLLDKLVQFLGDAGLKLNAEKTVLITTEAEPPPFLTTSTGAVIKVKGKIGSQMVGLRVVFSRVKKCNSGY